MMLVHFLGVSNTRVTDNVFTQDILFENKNITIILTLSLFAMSFTLPL